MQRFYWVIDGILAGCSRPGSEGTGTTQRERERMLKALTSDLAKLRQQGITAILSLTETPLADEVLLAHEFVSLHVPVPDFYPPTPEQLLTALHFIDEQRAAGRPTAVHCLAGQGRTGTVLAAYLIRDGQSAQEALTTIRALCPGAVEERRQEQALIAFAERRDWIV